MDAFNAVVFDRVLAARDHLVKVLDGDAGDPQVGRRTMQGCVVWMRSGWRAESAQRRRWPTPHARTTTAPRPATAEWSEVRADQRGTSQVRADQPPDRESAVAGPAPELTASFAAPRETRLTTSPARVPPGRGASG